MSTKKLQAVFDARNAALQAEAKREQLRRTMDGTAESKMTLQQYAEHTAWAKKEFGK